ncbi:barstar family protein [Chitinimonas koreensis]|uniref:barstar family protein n=1 Tax=Chitinimonas koreensis TaxID=356302 RepID=UPI0003F8CB08|nr:barstar family protein [Chitinimonas koreensis]QNM97494.1 barstar family protein [Chitinimonas koreensis]
MPMTRIEFVNVASVEDFYQQLEGQLELDYALGHNLDAVYDVLSTEVAGPLELVWHDAGFSRVALGEWFVRIADVLNSVSSERSDVNVSFG